MNSLPIFVRSLSNGAYEMKVKELKKILEADGWFLVRTKKHRVYQHLTKQPLNGRPLALSKHDNEELAPGTVNGILTNAGLK